MVLEGSLDSTGTSPVTESGYELVAEGAARTLVLTPESISDDTRVSD